MEWNLLFPLNGVLHHIKVYNFNVNVFSALGEVLSFRFSKIFYNISRAILHAHLYMYLCLIVHIYQIITNN